MKNTPLNKLEDMMQELKEIKIIQEKHDEMLRSKLGKIARLYPNEFRFLLKGMNLTLTPEMIIGLDALARGCNFGKCK